MIKPATQYSNPQILSGFNNNNSFTVLKNWAEKYELMAPYKTDTQTVT